MRLDCSIHWLIALVGAVCIISSMDVAASAILDSRCYLEGGGSAESFLVTEDLEVGAIIGKLRINGNANVENGDINLSLREKDASVEIVPGTKELALSVKLDKEGLHGPASIYVNVICLRRHSSDPSFVIPVNVRVIDVNDNAPQWIGTPYTLTLSEVTVPGTRILQGAHAEDADQPGPFSTIEYQVLPGPYSDYVQFLNPLDSTLVLKKPLDYETLKNFTVKLRAQDQGTPPKFSDTLLRVVVTDADDQNPKFLRETYTAELPIDARPGEIRVRPEPIKAVDQDEGLCAPIQYSIVQSQDTKYFRIHPHTGVITLLTPLGYADLMNGATLVVKATQIDNPDRYALTTVTLSRLGMVSHSEMMKSLTFVQKKVFTKIREDTPVGNRIIALPTNKPGKHIKYTITDPVNSQFFNVGALGELVLMKPLDYEKMTRHDFQVVATDGVTNTTADISLEIIDVNDWEPRFRETHYEFIVPKGSLSPKSDTFEGVKIGKVEAADGDRNDKLELSLRGQHAGLFEIDSTGNIYMRPEQLKRLNESTVHLVATATDTGLPPRSTSVPITVTMEGMALAQAPWGNKLLGMFGIIVVVAVLIISLLSCYIVNSKKKVRRKKAPPIGRNRVHSHNHDSTVSSANLVTHEKMSTTNGNGTGSLASGGVSVLHLKHGGNITMSNPISNGTLHHHHHHHSGSTAMALERERQRESYAATVRSIVSRASANGQLYEEDEIENDSLSQQDQSTSASAGTVRRTAWEAPSATTQQQQQQLQHGVTTIATSSGSSPGGMNNGASATGKASNLLTASEGINSSENNLTVYF